MWFKDVWMRHPARLELTHECLLNCDILVSEFKLQSRYNVHFRINTLRKDINYTKFTLVMGWILLLLFLYKDGFGIKYSLDVDMPLKKETKSKKMKLCTYNFIDTRCIQ